MDIPTLLPVLASLTAIGGFAGFLAGLLGVGGGIVLVPAFFYAFQSLGYDGPQLMQVCLATSLATIIVTSIRSTQSHHKKGAVDWQILRQWAPGIAEGGAFWRGPGCQFAIADLAADFRGFGGDYWAVFGIWPAILEHWRRPAHRPVAHCDRAAFGRAVGIAWDRWRLAWCAVYDLAPRTHSPGGRNGGGLWAGHCCALGFGLAVCVG